MSGFLTLLRARRTRAKPVAAISPNGAVCQAPHRRPFALANGRKVTTTPSRLQPGPRASRATESGIVRVVPHRARLHGLPFLGRRWLPVQPPRARIQRGADAIEEPIRLHRVSWPRDTGRPVSRTPTRTCVTAVDGDRVGRFYRSTQPDPAPSPLTAAAELCSRCPTQDVAAGCADLFVNNKLFAIYAQRTTPRRRASRRLGEGHADHQRLMIRQPEPLLLAAVRRAIGLGGRAPRRSRELERALGHSSRRLRARRNEAKS